MVASIFVCYLIAASAGTAKDPPILDIQHPTIVAFFTPVTQKELNDGGTNEALADFQYYAKQVRQPLKKAGIDFREVYSHSFRIRLGTRITIFHPREGVGYYLVSPSKKPRVEYGVLTDSDLLQIANAYFGVTSK